MEKNFEKENLTIQYALEDDLDHKKEVRDTESFLDSLQLEEWELQNDFPEAEEDLSK